MKKSEAEFISNIYNTSSVNYPHVIRLSCILSHLETIFSYWISRYFTNGVFMINFSQKGEYFYMIKKFFFELLAIFTFESIRPCFQTKS